MLARIQRLLALALLSAVLAGVSIALATGEIRWAAPTLAVIVIGYAGILAFEFAWMALAQRGDPAPAPAWRDILTAWWLELLAAPRVFLWRQPFRSDRWADHLPGSGVRRTGVILVHGFVCNRGLWNPHLRRLTQHGVPWIAVSLEPVFGSIDAYVPQIEEAVSAMQRRTGRPPIVVAHSMGGLAVRRWSVACDGNASRLAHLLTVGTPHAGTRLAALAFSRNGREMRVGSQWLVQLQALEAAQGEQGLGRRTTCFYSHTDNIVFPATHAVWPMARRIHLKATPHVHMVDHEAIWRELDLQLDRASCPERRGEKGAEQGTQDADQRKSASMSSTSLRVGNSPS